MTILELIHHLQLFPPDARVVVRGYEDGYNDILQLKQVKIKPSAKTFWWNGEYQESSDTNAIDAVELYGDNQNPVDYL